MKSGYSSVNAREADSTQSRSPGTLALVHLAGSRRGTIDVIEDEAVYVGTGADTGVHFLHDRDG